MLKGRRGERAGEMNIEWRDFKKPEGAIKMMRIIYLINTLFRRRYQLCRLHLRW